MSVNKLKRILASGSSGDSLYYSLIKRFKKICEADLRQTRRRTQAGLTPGKDDNEYGTNLTAKILNGFI